MWCPRCGASLHAQVNVPAWWTWTGEVESVLNSERPYYDLLDQLWPEIAASNPVSLTFSTDELVALSNCITEAMEAIADFELQTRVGSDRNDLETLRRPCLIR